MWARYSPFTMWQCGHDIHLSPCGSVGTIFSLHPAWGSVVTIFWGIKASCGSRQHSDPPLAQICPISLHRFIEPTSNKFFNVFWWFLMWSFFPCVIIITVSFWQAILRPFRSFRFAKIEGTIQYGYRKHGTHARVFSQMLAHENTKNEIR